MKKTMDANQIKLLAILAMTIDHIAWLEIGRAHV